MAQGAGPPDLSRATLEELLNMEITSASRREQRLADTAAAVFVITADAIRRSGLTEVPELLRLAPGVQVARIDASQWAISIRGFNTQWSDKLLVLVDGRTVYNRLFSGVYWNSVNLIPEDIERIEVIRGPGASVWGANAVNGVINILTKSSADTSGWLVRARSATPGSSDLAIRYGAGTNGRTYRVHALAFGRAASPAAAGGDAGDEWRGVQGGVRADWTGTRDVWLLQAQAERLETNRLSDVPTGVIPPAGGWQPVPSRDDATLAHVLLRWTRRTGRGLMEVQSFVDGHTRTVPGLDTYRAVTLDVDGRYDVAAGGHRIVTGAGYRQTSDRLDGTFFTSFDPDRATVRTINLYAQDEVAIAADRLRVTFGTKVEHDTLSGWGVQPTARVLWAMSPRQRLWSAVSRALRSPSRGDVAMRVNFATMVAPDGTPIVAAVFGSPDYRAEEARSIEVGYRFDAPQVSLDATVFRTAHTGLRTYEQSLPVFETDPVPPHLLVPLPQFNNLDTDSAGLELAVRWSPHAAWRLDAGYTFFTLTPEPAAGSTDPSAAVFDGYAPRHQWLVRPGFEVGDVQAEVGVYRVGALAVVGVSAYTRADVHVAWHASPAWSVQLSGRNLTGDHAEFTGDQLVTVPALDARRIGVTLLWRR
ncbi:MAG TPA: TonB-dependent receptor [Vicinamibacterales bacterium]|nr:TonB-dependent receptor [Vicinamibacterales bacterium]